MADHPATDNIIATTLPGMIAEVYDNVYFGTPVTAFLYMNGVFKTEPGGHSIVRTIQNKSVANLHTHDGGFHTMTATTRQGFVTASFPWKYFVGDITWTTKENVQNSGTRAVVNLLAQKVKALTEEHQQFLETRTLGEYDNSTATEPSGIRTMLKKDGTVGGIDPTANSNANAWWNPKEVDKEAAAPAVVHLSELFLELSKGNTKRPNLILSTSKKFHALKTEANKLQRFTHDGLESLGVPYTMVENIPYIPSDVDIATAAGLEDTKIYVLTTDSIEFCRSDAVWMNTSEMDTLSEKLGKQMTMESAGNLIVTERRVNGYLKYNT